jgi:2-dehydro-3-deoxyphosphogluconate aldolase / (4S)-4-hydroxy-2-oxoglutarate aldolase
MNHQPDQRIGATLGDLLAEGIILCIRFQEGSRVLEACRAAIRGGLRVLEITLTTPDALTAIEELSREEGVIVGAGTVLTIDDLVAVERAGGRFVLSPVCDPEVLAAARERGILAIPGAATPTEALAAYRLGAKLVKIFPSGVLGGPAYLRAIRGPLGHIPMLPTSGPTSDTMGEWLAAGAIVVGVGPEVFPPDFTLEGVEASARRVRNSFDTASHLIR